jgi:hypothetical protein
MVKVLLIGSLLETLEIILVHCVGMFSGGEVQHM